MSSIENCQFYCLTFNNEERKNIMIERFKNLEIPCRFYSGVPYNDKRISNSINQNAKRQWSMTYGHLDIIHNFYYHSDKRYAVICEDDICLHSRLKQILNKVINDFNLLNLDIILLGYLLPYKIGNEHLFINYKLKKDMPCNSYFKYHDYPEYLSGTQMYMITKKYAKYLLKNYYTNYAGIGEKCFNPDKIITKDGNKALIYPMLAIENDNQVDLYHKLCRNIHCNDFFI
jgi:GR25 family glycosyltransferase involved in LPS biosynthesis